jgi:HEPN domain-containing protein
MASDDRARQLAREWIAAADRQLELAAIALDRQLSNEAVALSPSATERSPKAMLTSTNQPFEYTHVIDRPIAKQDDDIREALADILTPRIRQQLTDDGTIGRCPGGPSYVRDEYKVAAAVPSTPHRPSRGSCLGAVLLAAPGPGATSRTTGTGRREH